MISCISPKEWEESHIWVWKKHFGVIICEAKQQLSPNGGGAIAENRECVCGKCKQNRFFPREHTVDDLT